MMKTSNLIPIKPKVKFVVRVIKAQYAESPKGEPIIKEYFVIKLENKDTLTEVMYPLGTNFIFSEWKNSQPNTMKAAANKVVMFLNFLIENKKEYRLKTLYELEPEYAIDFLNELSFHRTSKNTVKGHEKILIKFYDYLNNNNIIHKKLVIKGIDYFSKKQESRLHKLPDEYLLTFLEVAYQVDSKIAFILYLQFFGGIRTGEIFNLRVRDIQMIGNKGQYGFILDLTEDRLLRKDLNTAGSSYIKSKRWQIVFGFKNWSTLFYEKHMKNIKKIVIDGDSPLFPNRDGLAMTGNNYYYHFKKVKKIFLQTLRNSNNIEDRNNALAIDSSRWSTHIGRGIFSNLLAEEADNLYDVSFPRGDKSFDSVKPYLANTKRIKEKLEKKIDEIFKTKLKE